MKSGSSTAAASRFWSWQWFSNPARLTIWKQKQRIWRIVRRTRSSLVGVGYRLGKRPARNWTRTREWAVLEDAIGENSPSLDPADFAGYAGVVDNRMVFPYFCFCGEDPKSRHVRNLCRILHVDEKANCADTKGGFIARFARVSWRYHQRPHQPHNDAGGTVRPAGQGRPGRHR